MPRAIKFEQYGGLDVLEVVEVPAPTPTSGQLLVRVKAAGINPGESKIREGLLHERWPATFPSGQGSDLAGVIEQLGPDTPGFQVGDEVIGFTDDRASHADLVLVEAEHATPRPADVSWEVAGALFVAGTTAYAMVRAVNISPQDTIVVAGAAGGVGTIAVQLAKHTGAKVIGLASERNHDWLRRHGVIPVTYGDGVAERITAATDSRPDALLDTVGGGYVALGIQLGLAPERIDTIADFEAAVEYGVKTAGNIDGASATVLAELAALVSTGELEIPIAGVYPLAQVREAFRELELNHTRGKIVLKP